MDARAAGGNGLSEACLLALLWFDATHYEELQVSVVFRIMCRVCVDRGVALCVCLCSVDALWLLALAMQPSGFWGGCHASPLAVFPLPLITRVGGSVARL